MTPVSRANLSRGTFLLSEERTKRFTLRLDKQDEDGERSVTALFATFNVVDLDGDVTEPGAFGKQSVLMGAYNHNPGMLPPGKGATYEEDDTALFKGRFFTTSSGTEHYTTIKEAGGTMEWSYRFFVEDGGFETRDGENVFIIRKAKVTHVAPVEAGAGIGTRTVDIKCVDCDAKANPAPNFILAGSSPYSIRVKRQERFHRLHEAGRDHRDCGGGSFTFPIYRLQRRGL